MNIALTSLATTVIGLLLGHIFTMRKVKAEINKTNADAIKSEHDAAKSKQETVALTQDTQAKRIEWLDKYANTLDEKLRLKDLIIEGLNKRIEEKEAVEKTYIKEIQELKDKVDELANQVSKLSNSVSKTAIKTIKATK